MSPITTHVLDTSMGRPAAGLRVVLERGGKSSEWQIVGHGETDEDGRLRTLMAEQAPLAIGSVSARVRHAPLLRGRGVRALYPSVIITFEVAEDGAKSAAHYHMPLLLSPFGYTTYRGS